MRDTTAGRETILRNNGDSQYFGKMGRGGAAVPIEVGQLGE